MSNRFENNLQRVLTETMLPRKTFLQLMAVVTATLVGCKPSHSEAPASTVASAPINEAPNLENKQDQPEAVERTKEEKIAEKRELALAVNAFMREKYDIEVPEAELYTEYDDTVIPRYVVYASYNDAIQAPEGFSKENRVSETYATREEAEARLVQLSQYDFVVTYLYEAEATSNNTVLYPQLLDYPPEVFAITVFHEGFHKYLKNLNVPFVTTEEAVAEEFALRATVEFAKETGLVDLKASQYQLEKNKEIYHFLDMIIEEVRVGKGTPEKFAEWKIEYEQMLIGIDPVNLKRYSLGDASFNNAYLLRYSMFADQLPQVEALTEKLHGDLKNLIKYYTHSVLEDSESTISMFEAVVNSVLPQQDQ